MNDDSAGMIRLEQFLKCVGAVETGGHAKILIQNGHVLVNGDVELRRRKQLHAGDTVELDGQPFVVGPEFLRAES